LQRGFRDRQYSIFPALACIRRKTAAQDEMVLTNSYLTS